MDVVEIDEQLFERPLVAIDLLGNLGESAVTAIDVVDLAGAVEPDTGLKHRRRNGVSLDGDGSGDGAIVWSSLARKFRFYLLQTCMLMHLLDGILGMERNLRIVTHRTIYDDLYRPTNGNRKR